MVDAELYREEKVERWCRRGSIAWFHNQLVERGLIRHEEWQHIQDGVEVRRFRRRDRSSDLENAFDYLDTPVIRGAGRMCRCREQRALSGLHPR